jgi:DNA-binding CsgD family transcriptional regulator
MLPTTCGFYRGISDSEFGAKEKKQLSILLPHLSRALGVMRLLRDADLRVAAGKATLDRLSSAILLMNDAGAVVHMNTMAHQLISDEDGLKLRASNSSPRNFGTLACADATASKELSSVIKSTLEEKIVNNQHFSRLLKIPRLSGRPPYLFKVSRLAAKNEFSNEHSSPALIAFIVDSAAGTQMNIALLRDVYGFTPAEARVAVANFTAGSIDEIADTLGISRNTVKAHLKKVYLKADVDNQSKLIKLLLSFTNIVQ